MRSRRELTFFGGGSDMVWVVVVVVKRLRSRAERSSYSLGWTAELRKRDAPYSSDLRTPERLRQSPTVPNMALVVVRAANM